MVHALRHHGLPEPKANDFPKWHEKTALSRNGADCMEYVRLQGDRGSYKSPLDLDPIIV